ncbi:MAG: DUF1631 domain-containing protein, partial [Porticoccaceae bacterium]|nr:DUF1631 domain-containing protein [Porticoccaceae bacterium]
GLALPLKMLCDRTLQFLGQCGGRVFDQVNESFFDLADSSANAGLQTAYFDAIKQLRADKTVIIDQWLAAVASAFDDLAVMAVSRDDDYRGPSEFISLLGDDDLEEVVAFDQIVSAANECNRCELLVLQRRVSKVSNRKISLPQLPLSPEFITEQFAGALRSRNLALQPKLSLLELYNGVVLGQLPELLLQSNQLLEDLGILPSLMPETEGVEAVGTEVARSAASGQLAGRKNDAADHISSTSGIVFSELEPRFSGVARSLDIDSRKGRRLAGVRRNRANTIALIIQSRSADGDLTQTGSEEQGGRRDSRESNISHKDLLELLQHIPVIADLADSHTESESNGDCLPQQQRAGKGIRYQIDAAFSQQKQCFANLNDHDQGIIILLDQWFHLIGERFDGKGQEVGKLSALFSRIELPVCRAVLSDPSFFDFAQHPLRRLLNEVFRAGDWLRGVEGLSKDPLYKKLDELLKCVLCAEKDAGIDSVLCGDLLSDLIRFIDVDQRRIRAIEKRLMEQARAEDTINIARCGVDELLISRLAGKEFGYALVEFVEKAWASVLFRASLKCGMESEQWVGAVHLLDQLLGLEPVDEIDEEFLDRLVGILSESLADISFDSYEVQRMFSNIRRYLLEDKNKAENAQPVIFDKAEAQQIDDYSLRVRVESVNPVIPGESNSAEKELTGSVDDNLLMEVDSLKQGTWVELKDDNAGESRPCRLIGSVGSAGKYLFGDRNGCQTVAFSRNRLALKLKAGELTMLDNSHLFDDLLVEAIGDTRPVE